MKDQIRFDTKSSGAGHSYVLDMLAAWRAHHKHHSELNKAAGIVDGDANTVKTAFNSGSGNTKSAKCFCYPKTPLIQGALAKGFNVINDLESLYPPEIWGWAKDNSWLEARKKADAYPKTAIEALCNGAGLPGDFIDDGWKIYIEYGFKYDKKITCANQIAEKPDDEVREILSAMKRFLEDVLTYLAVEFP